MVKDYRYSAPENQSFVTVRVAVRVTLDSSTLAAAAAFVALE